MVLLLTTAIAIAASTTGAATSALVWMGGGCFWQGRKAITCEEEEAFESFCKEVDRCDREETDEVCLEPVEAEQEEVRIMIEQAIADGWGEVLEETDGEIWETVLSSMWACDGVPFSPESATSENATALSKAAVVVRDEPPTLDDIFDAEDGKLVEGVVGKRKVRQPYIRRLVRLLKAEYGRLQFTEANEMMLRRRVKDVMTLHGVRNTDIVNHLPKVVMMVLTPSDEQIREAQFYSSHAFKIRQESAKVIWMSDWIPWERLARYFLGPALSRPAGE